MTVLVPTGKIAGALLVTVTTPQLSATGGVPRATLVAPHIAGEAKTVTRVGQEIVGGWLSVTITSCGQGAELPLASLTVQITVLVPTENMAGVLLDSMTGSHLSPTVRTPRATLVAPHIAGEAKTVTRVGQEILGG